MSHPLKKPRAVYPVEEYASDDEDDESMDEFIGQTIDVDFDAFKATDSDFHGIKILLQQTFRGLNIDLSGLADIIISQNYIGSVVKQVHDEDEEDDEETNSPAADEDQLFGVSSVINLTARKDEEPISKLRTALVELCQSHGSDTTCKLVRESLGNESTHVGLLISERLVNLPVTFAMPVYESLMTELEDATKKGMPYKFKYFVMICKFCKEKSQNRSSHEQEIVWSNPEEEIFDEESLASFEFKVKDESDRSHDWDEDGKQMDPWRKVLVFEAQNLPQILDKVRQAVS